MAAPKIAPVPPVDTVRMYSSPPVAPPSWVPDRPGEVRGSQPVGPQLGYQGPDQGYGLKMARGFRDRLLLEPGEHVADIIRGCLAIALRRASMFGRAPVVHDLTIAYTIWGVLKPGAPASLIEARRRYFAGVAHSHHYTELRTIVDMVPESTLRLSVQQVEAARPEAWAELAGLHES